MKNPKAYNKRNSNQRKISIFLAVVIIGYLFFFTSKFTFPTPVTNKESVTAIDTQTEYMDGRSYRVLSMDYSKEQEVAEIKIQFINDTYDNVNEYFYVVNLNGGSSKNAKVEEVLNDNLMSVIRISNLKSFNELNFFFAPKVAKRDKITEAQTCELIFNKYNINFVDSIDTNKTKTDYLVDRLNYLIADYEKTLEKQNATLDELETKILSLQNQNSAIEKNRPYMSDEEYAAGQETITSNLGTISDTQQSVTEQKVKVDETEKLISDTKNKIAEIKK